MGLRPQTVGIDARVAMPPEVQRAMHDSAESVLLSDLCVLCDLCVTTLPPAREDIRPGTHPAINHSATRQADIPSIMDNPAAAPDPTNRIIGLGIKVHRKLGPGLLESVYQECLCWELANDNLAFKRQVPLAMTVKGRQPIVMIPVRVKPL